MFLITELFFFQLNFNAIWIYNVLQETNWLSKKNPKNLKIKKKSEFFVFNLIMELIIRTEPTIALGFSLQLTLSISFLSFPHLSLSSPTSQRCCIAKAPVFWWLSSHQFISLPQSPLSSSISTEMSVSLTIVKPHSLKTRRKMWSFTIWFSVQSSFLQICCLSCLLRAKKKLFILERAP